MKILLIKDENEKARFSTILKTIEKVVTGLETEYDTVSVEHYRNLGVLDIKRVRCIATKEIYK
jgi:hypothetical protein